MNFIGMDEVRAYIDDLLLITSGITKNIWPSLTKCFYDSARRDKVNAEKSKFCTGVRIPRLLDY
jgi:hypothetical protein